MFPYDDFDTSNFHVPTADWFDRSAAEAINPANTTAHAPASIAKRIILLIVGASML
jgi:hypothetical protein